MEAFYISEADFRGFVEAILKTAKVIAPVAKKSKFVFDELESFDELRLDYDVTILPPKKAFFPVKQELVRFHGNKVTSSIDPQPQILLGVHFYDVKAIDMLDEVFRSGHCDMNYIANRDAATIIASNIQKVSSRAFFGSVGTEVEAKGHDAFLTRIAGGYVYEVRTPKGDALRKHGKFVPASEAQKAEAHRVNADVLKKCPETLKWSSKEIQERVRSSFGNEALWTDLAKNCFSCGACNLVCPTCYCFDVQDEWSVDGTSGTRCRTWDGCQLEDFAAVSLGGGHGENFREKPAQRYRHRMMRKAAYLNDKLGGPACVGCGRCSVSCVPDIADPVAIISKIMEG